MWMLLEVNGCIAKAIRGPKWIYKINTVWQAHEHILIILSALHFKKAHPINEVR